jgi:transcriptional regulator with XRE-family HTH domain
VSTKKTRQKALVKEKTRVQKALIQMRRQLNLTQQQLAARLNVALPTVGKWESTRSPTGESLIQLAAFAYRTGQHETAKVFFAAGAQLPLAAGDFLFPQAAEDAIRQIRAGRSYPAVAREYLNVLRAVVAALHVCVEETIEAYRLGTDFLSIRDLLELQRSLREELADEEKQTKKK